jgi:hypothetical protein
VSLRAFHLFFVTVAALASFGFAAWALAAHPAAAPAYCALGLLGGLALSAWARRAARELKGGAA